MAETFFAGDIDGGWKKIYYRDFREHVNALEERGKL